MQGWVVGGGSGSRNRKIVGKFIVKMAKERITWCWAEVNTWMAFMIIQLNKISFLYKIFLFHSVAFQTPVL
jgi:hypothetical protein